MSSIGLRIKEQRAVLGISQQKLANEIGVSVDTIRSIEIDRARPSIETLAKLAEIFKCSTDYLLGIDHMNEKDREILNRVRLLDDDAQAYIIGIIEKLEKDTP